MKVTKIEESKLSKIDDTIFRCISYSIGTPEFESKISNNTKINSGYYKINKNIFMSIWKYKNIYGGMNTNDDNFDDACKIMRSGFITEKIIVQTHSPMFPKVNGYLRDELKIFYN